LADVFDYYAEAPSAFIPQANVEGVERDPPAASLRFDDGWKALEGD
jgi:hypothetical protein